MSTRTRDPAFARTLGQNLTELREAVGISQEELGFMADLHRTEISQLERGERTPKADTLLRLRDSLGVSADRLLKGLKWTPSEFTRGQIVVAEETHHARDGGPNEAGR